MHFVWIYSSTPFIIISLSLFLPHHPPPFTMPDFIHHYREEEMEVYRLYGADDTGKHKRLRIFDQVNSYFEIQIPK